MMSAAFDSVGLSHPLWVCFVVMVPICMIASFIIQIMYDKVLKKVNP